jgi:hypothetical protein
LKFFAGAGDIQRPFDFRGIAARRELRDFEPVEI